jgi:hypothetical protein
MLLYSRKKVRYRRDGYCWKKRKDGKTTREDHMKLKVQGTEVSVNHRISIPTYAIVRSTARHAIHLQIDISANSLGIRAVQIPKCIV